MLLSDDSHNIFMLTYGKTFTFLVQNLQIIYAYLQPPLPTHPTSYPTEQPPLPSSEKGNLLSFSDSLDLWLPYTAQQLEVFNQLGTGIWKFMGA